MKVLFGTNHFEFVAGSELVILEMAEYFMALGHSVDIAVNHGGNPMRGIARRAGARVLQAGAEINALEYDLVLVINHIAPLLSYSASADMAPRTHFVFIHVDLHWDMSQPGLVHEPLLADRILVHSAEAARHFTALGLPQDKLRIFHNAAPDAFWVGADRTRARLRTVSVVSNHAPDEVRSAISLLEASGLRVRFFGRSPGGSVRRIQPRDLAHSDAVISIGKTVQYCLAQRVPVFVYDHFGGPGYLDADNFERCAWFNFSGRCTSRRLEDQALVDALAAGWPAAVAFIAGLAPDTLERFRLRPYLDRLLAECAGALGNDERLARLEPHRLMMHRERALASGAGKYFRAWRLAEERRDATT